MEKKRCEEKKSKSKKVSGGGRLLAIYFTVKMVAKRGFL